MVGKIINSSETNTRLNYAVPLTVLKAFIESDSTQTRNDVVEVKPDAELGIVIFKLGGRGGPAYVDRVRRGGPAADAGLKPDDLIITIGGEKVGSVREYEEVCSNVVPGQELVVVVKRGVEMVRLSVMPVAKAGAEEAGNETGGQEQESGRPEAGDQKEEERIRNSEVGILNRSSVEPFLFCSTHTQEGEAPGR